MTSHRDSFRVTTPSDREVLVERDFAAPRGRVFDAFTRPELVRQWLLGPEGWTMPVCEIDLRVGGAYRYEWWKASTKTRMGVGGTFLEVVRPERLVFTERFDDAWYPGDAVSTTTFEDRGRGTTHVSQRIRYASREARDIATRSGMARGMAAGYDRVERMLAGPAIDPPTIVHTEPQLAATIRLTIPRPEIRSAIGPALGEIMDALRAQGIEPTGPWFDHHFVADPATFDFEVCVPVGTAVTPTGRVVPHEFPAMRVAETTLHGPYGGLASAWTAFDQWVREQGHVASPDFYQCYAVGPASGRDPSGWHTRLRRPLGIDS